MASIVSNASPSASAGSPRSLLSLAVVERQLIMQALDIQSLSRMARSCTQLRAESMHPASGCFLGVLRSVFKLSPASDNVGHDCPLVRAHAHMEARLDGMSSGLNDRSLNEFLSKLASFRRITELSLWDSPPNLSEVDALRLIAAVPLVETLWGVRTGSVFVQSLRVQEAVFRLPHLTRCGLDFAEPGGEFKPSLLALTPKLWNVIVSAPVTDLSPLHLLPSLPHLRRVLYMFGPMSGLERESCAVYLPSVEEFGFEEADGQPSMEQVEAILRGMPALKRITFYQSDSSSQVLRCIMALEPRILPALDWIELERSRHYDAELIAEFLVIFPAVEFRVPIQSHADRDSATLDVRRVTRIADDEYFSVRRLLA